MTSEEKVYDERRHARTVEILSYCICVVRMRSSHDAKGTEYSNHCVYSRCQHISDGDIPSVLFWLSALAHDLSNCVVHHEGQSETASDPRDVTTKVGHFSVIVGQIS